MTPEIAFSLSILLVAIGQLLNAGVVLIDKHIVTHTTVNKPGVYTFYVGMISGFVLLLLPFGIIGVPNEKTIFLSLDIGFVFVLSLILLFRALKHANATDVIAWLTAVSTVTTFILSNIFLNEKLPENMPYAVAFFVLGIILVGHFRFYARSFFQTIGAGMLFGLSAVLLKILFLEVSFVDGFFWSRVGNMIAALSLLLLPSIRSNLFHISKNTHHKTGILIVGNRILGGLAFVCILYAIKLGSVSVVNALSSLQFFFIFLLVFVLGNQLPKLYAHEFRPGHVFHKVLAMVFIAIGFFVLFL